MLSRIAYLISQYNRSEISAEEELELNEWINAGYENAELFNELTDPDRIKVHFEKMDSYDENLVRSKIEAQIPNAFLHRSTVKKLWYRIAAAAAVLIIAGGTFFYLSNKKNKIENLASAPQEVRYKNDVQPGGNKAVLTLGNGSTIILDSAHNGRLAQQGATTIEKTDSGKLAYHIQENEKPKQVLYNVLSTPRGGQYELTLPDGSEVWLNAASSIKYPTAFGGSERKVEITGEAYFEVKKDTRMPFTVSVNGMEVQVLGTHFNVNAYADEASINTTLLEGSVKVTKGNETETIKPGEQAQLNANGKIKIINSADIETTMSWKNGKFVFQGANIQTIMKQLVRWYDVDVTFEGNISDEFVADISRNVEISKMLKLLELTGRVHFIINGKKVKVIP